MFRGDGMRGGDKFRQALIQAAHRAQSGKVRVGIVKSGTYDDGTQVAEAAFYNEYGTAHIPPRPFFRNTVAEHKSEWPRQMVEALKENQFDVPKSLAQMGMGVRDQVVATIQGFNDPPNAKSTVKKKGFDKPLIDTGTLWRSIDYEVGE